MNQGSNSAAFPANVVPWASHVLSLSFLICETMMIVSVKCLARCLAQLVLNKRYVLFKSILFAGKQSMDVDRNRDANQGRKSVILSFPFLQLLYQTYLSLSVEAVGMFVRFPGRQRSY